MAIKVAINGLGRIGRCVARIVANREDVELVAVNASGSEEMIQYNLRYDTVHGNRQDIKVEDGYVYIGNDKAKLLSERDPAKLEFAALGAEVVLECTGAFLTMDSVQSYIDSGVKKVVMSAPAKDDTPTFVMGANEKTYAGQAIVSNASCTTNGLAPVAKLLDDEYGIEKGLMTTIHSYTSSQPILDAKDKKDPRKGRAGATNLIPASTGAAKAIGKVMPHLNGKLNGQAIRVPTPNVSLVDLTVTLKKDASLEEIQAAFTSASTGYLKGILGIDTEGRVSSDFNGEELSTVVPLDTIQVIEGNMVKVLAWYDNEWGYSSRLVDMGVHVATN
ncbi:type I glyceraldehyde-3-phosphate dehydrogenase [Poseidonibacter ostreae]|jgi:glyceraldehyde 3-phosphate dehydrogenase|uniref:Glyceraldehyde-3-phosphate dehydrogenase n=1 Tax=Poseidonibacter ostreae TaxID=2654171 RepID=A0A6L4WTT6_9BACT|nr:type I glyceraldehyde-3-phosphate dehydrogenase [Poseidonibacter ostreae]KAB7886010.1 type I glyceraldehyde-3-phosphate dehydrogenase [Poseidonibacter ostreae]KAB7889462.1 type I glyceraldehyde-3-phosphate dehydrogenase [Poseidonibacter ostreae]KAB7892523.1 type I glyceraldehyde-3-phosphate dehydrogenase [Poseidonibacter ostreae]